MVILSSSDEKMRVSSVVGKPFLFYTRVIIRLIHSVLNVDNLFIHVKKRQILMAG